MALKAAFIFVAPECDPAQHRSVVKAPVVELITVGVKTYGEGCEVARRLVAEGVGAIELCGAFGNEGVAAITKAVEGKAVVGVVRFDHHPGFDHLSGDQLFQ